MLKRSNVEGGLNGRCPAEEVIWRSPRSFDLLDRLGIAALPGYRRCKAHEVIRRLHPGCIELYTQWVDIIGH